MTVAGTLLVLCYYVQAFFSLYLCSQAAACGKYTPNVVTTPRGNLQHTTYDQP